MEKTSKIINLFTILVGIFVAVLAYLILEASDKFRVESLKKTTELTEATQALAEARKRSASTYLSGAKGVNLDINAGITDGHNGSVPISHSLEAFNILAAKKDRISTELMEGFTQTAKVPKVLLDQAPTDSSYGEKTVRFRRVSGNVRVTIFQGGHEIIPSAALQWLSKQKKMRAPKNE